MRKGPPGLAPVTLAELISDPIVQMLMKADHVTAQDLTELIQMVESKQRITQMKMDGREEVPRAPSEYRSGVGIMLVNRNNRVFVGHRRKPKGAGWQMPQPKLTLAKLLKQPRFVN